MRYSFRLDGAVHELFGDKLLRLWVTVLSSLWVIDMTFPHTWLEKHTAQHHTEVLRIFQSDKNKQLAFWKHDFFH